MDYRICQALEAISRDLVELKGEYISLRRELSDINDRLDTITFHVGKTNDDLSGIKSSTEKMSDHIDFVDGVYTTVKKPLESILRISSGMIEYDPPIKEV